MAMKNVTVINADTIEHKGKRYTKVGADVVAKKGDVFKASSVGQLLVDVVEGAFYKVKGVDSANDPQFNDDVKFMRNPSKKIIAELYRKVKGEQTAPVTPQVDDVVTFEGFDGEYRKVDRKAQAGDVVVFRENEYSGLTNGVPYLAKNGHTGLVVNVATKLYLTGYGRSVANTDVYEKVEAKYVPQEGDIVVVTANNTGSQNSVGDIGKVGAEKPLADGGVCVYVPGGPTSCIRTWPSDIRKATPAEVEAYEQALLTYEKALHKASFKVGDTVKLIKSDRGNTGEYAEIIEVGTFKANTPRGVEGMTYLVRMLTGKDASNVFAGDDSYYVKATQADVDKALAPKLKAGDFVKLTRKRSYYNNDRVYEVVERDGSLGVIDEGSDFVIGALVHGDYVQVSADGAKWAKIGRKVGEFRKGDIVRVLDELCTEYLEVGQIVTVAHDETCGGTGIHVNTVGKGTRYAIVELIAPVESTLK